MDEIYAAGGELALVLTLQDDIARAKSGRILVDEFCRERNVPLLKISNINEEAAVGGVRSAHLDWIFVIGWSQIANRPFLESTGSGVLGMHPSLLPQGRGRASIPWAIIKGLAETGVTLFKLDDGVDTGPILTQERVPIDINETATSLYRKVTNAHRSLIHSAWRSLVGGSALFKQQDESRATVWPGRTPEDGRLRPDMTVADAERLVRATTHPYPGAFIDLPRGRLRIWSGTPGSEEGGVALELADGSYTAKDTAWEAAPWRERG